MPIAYTYPVSSSCTVLIAAPEILHVLKKRPDMGGADLLAFTDGEILRALQVITERRPEIVALERMFAATPRGAALIKRIRNDPSLRDSEIRVVSQDEDSGRASPPRGTAGAGAGAAAAVPLNAPLDRIGTRRAQRHKVDELVEVLVDGNPASVVDLSTVGAQVVSPIVLKPNQRVRVTLSDDQGALRFNAAVAWASFEIPPKGGPRYRAGIEFLDASGAAVDAYATRHRVS